jgi:hypothetical protein
VVSTQGPGKGMPRPMPIHWGTFAPIGSSGRHLEPASEPAWVFVAHVAERAPSVVARLLAPGESVALADA